MKKIIAFLITALLASSAFAATPVAETPVAPSGSESLVNTNGLNNNTSDEEKAAVDNPEAADASGVQDADD